MTRISIVVLVVGLLALGAGCSPYVEDFEYMPRPGLAEIATTQPAQGPTISALASIVGVRRADDKFHIPTSVEVRMQFENSGPQPAYLDPRSLSLTTADLLNFAPPPDMPQGPILLPVGQQTIINANFPFPPGHSYDDVDMNSLQLRWLVLIGDQSIRQVIFFRRVYYYYYNYPDDYWGYPRVWIGGTFIIRHRR